MSNAIYLHEIIQGKSNYVWILDAGHGGITKDGKYTTAPKKMFNHGDFTIYEGVVNRQITTLVIKELIAAGIDHKVVYSEVEDDPLNLRVSRADACYARHKNCIFLSIHSNAGGGSGFEIFTSPGQTKSDKVANVFCEVYQKHFPNHPFRKDSADGDADKEADFYVLRKTDCPALLVENLFFDNRREAEYLMSPQGQGDIANAIVSSTMMVEKLQVV